MASPPRKGVMRKHCSSADSSILSENEDNLSTQAPPPQTQASP